MDGAMKYEWNSASGGHRNVIKSALKSFITDEELWDIDPTLQWEELSPRSRQFISAVTIEKDGDFTFYKTDRTKLVQLG